MTNNNVEMLTWNILDLKLGHFVYVFYKKDVDYIREKAPFNIGYNTVEGDMKDDIHSYKIWKDESILSKGYEVEHD